MFRLTNKIGFFKNVQLPKLLINNVRLISSKIPNLYDSELSYVHGEPPISYPPVTYSPLTLGEFLKRSVKIDPNHIGFIVDHQNIKKTYGQFDNDVDRLALALRSFGCKRGSKIGLWAFNCYEWLLMQFATAKLGAILVAINPAYKEREMLNVLRLIGIDTIIMNQKFRTSNYAELMQNIAPGIFETANNGSPHVHCKELPDLKNLIVIDQYDDEEETIPSNVCRFSQLLNPSFKSENIWNEIDETQFDDVINVQFTSGTTGLPKGSMLTHFNIIQNGRFIAPRIFENLNEPPVVCIPNPMYHAFGSVVGTIAVLFMHGTVVLPAPVFNSESTLKSVEKNQCNCLYGTPTMWTDIIKRPLSKYDLSSLKRGVMSGAPCPPVLLRQVHEMIPSIQHISIPYGSTEIGPVATCTKINDKHNHRFESVGSPLPYVEIKIKNIQNNSTVKRNQHGEVLIRSHGTFPGYMNQPDKTREVVDDNFWYHTGDVGYLDSDGYLHINGRIKEMIIRGGENIYPKEVEDLIMQICTDIDEIHVVGIDDQRLGEEIVAFVKLNSKHINKWNEKKLQDFLRSKISHFKVPKHIKFVDKFPRTLTGKVRKLELKEMAKKIVV